MKKIFFKPVLHSSISVVAILILLMALVGFISMDMYFPSLPAIRESYNINVGTAQLTLTLFLCGFGFSQLFYGPLSDYYGRRPVLLTGFFIYLVATSALIITSNLSALLIARLAQGIGAGAGASLSRVLLRDNFIGNKMAQVTSYLTIGVALATALAPALGGYIQQIAGFRSNFIAMLIFGVFVTIVILLYLPETNKSLGCNTLHPFKVIKGYGILLLNKTFVCNILCSSLALSGLLAYAMMNPFLLQNNFHISSTYYGLITLVIASGELIGTYINAQFVARINHTAMMFVGIAIMLIAAVSLLIFNMLGIFTISSIVISTFILTISIGITIPNATAGAFSEFNSSIGSVGAIYGSFQIVITMITTYFIASIPHQTPWHLGYILLTLGLATLAIYSYLSYQKMELSLSNF